MEQKKGIEIVINEDGTMTPHIIGNPSDVELMGLLKYMERVGDIEDNGKVVELVSRQGAGLQNILQGISQTMSLMNQRLQMLSEGKEKVSEEPEEECQQD